ncbi:MAG: S8 family peptidase, partial [Clostridia bacterium]|nr:S8 family peptidase [Clostridia bacterium]
ENDYVTLDVYKKEIELLAKVIADGKADSAMILFGTRLSISGTTQSRLTSDEYAIEDALSDVGITATSYTGSGITVGIIETIDQSSFPGHKEMVESIIREIAPDVTVELRQVNQHHDLYDAMGELASEINVDVINISLSQQFESYYHADSAFTLDYWSNVYDCLFVCSAGNSGREYAYAPASAPNAIAVASVNKNGTVSDFSSYGASLSDCTKPELAAPGEDLSGQYTKTNGTQQTYTSISGTSFASPIVVGIAALLMDEFPDLQNNPAVLKAILLQSCNKVYSSGTTVDPKAGAGLVNYANARTIARNERYKSDAYEKETANNTRLMNFDDEGNAYKLYISVPRNQTASIYLTSLEPGAAFGDKGILMGSDVPLSSYIIKLINPATGSIVSQTTISKNFGALTYSNTTTTTKYFQVQVFINQADFTGVTAANNDIASSSTDGCFANADPIYKVAIAYNVSEHSHSYPTTWAQGVTGHSKTCACGYAIKETHSLLNGRCSICGYRGNVIIEPWQRPDEAEIQ